MYSNVTSLSECGIALCLRSWYTVIHNRWHFCTLLFYTHTYIWYILYKFSYARSKPHVSFSICNVLLVLAPKKKQRNDAAALQSGNMSSQAPSNIPKSTDSASLTNAKQATTNSTKPPYLPVQPSGPSNVATARKAAAPIISGELYLDTLGLGVD